MVLQKNVEKVLRQGKVLQLFRILIDSAAIHHRRSIRMRLTSSQGKTGKCARSNAKAFLQKIADRKNMESAEVPFAVFKGDRVHDKMQMTVCRVHVQGIYDLVPREKMADIVT